MAPALKRTVRAFTLVELLVVIGIIAILISILLPSLNKARESANSVACLANLRSIGQAMYMYTTQNKNCIPGSAMTTGRYLWINSGGALTKGSNSSGVYNTTNIEPEGPIQTYDWINPLAKVMGLKVPNTANGIAVFTYYQTLPQFSCPSNKGVLASPFAPSVVPAGAALSYASAASFMLTQFGSAGMTGATGVVTGNDPSSGYWNLPQGYFPKVTKIGNASQKIFVADSGKYSNSYDAVVPSINYSTTSSVISNHQFNDFSDYGAFFGNSKCWDRSGGKNKFTGAALPNTSTVLRDGRIFAFRHGSKPNRDSSGNMRANAVFYDGHAENLDDLTLANPSLWLPKGTTIANPAATIASGRPFVWPDAVTANNIPTPYTVP